MLTYKCENCNITCNTSICPLCKERTVIVDSSIFWCGECNIPLFSDTCPICGHKAKKIGSDIRPVFPEERLLLEILIGEPFKYINCSVWNTAGNYYYANGAKIPFSVSQTKAINSDAVRKQIGELSSKNTYDSFNKYIRNFVKANSTRYSDITSEATEYIRRQAASFNTTEMFVSFSGGKDSTVTSDLVLRALSSQQVLHLYGDTTLEFPETKAYIERFKKAHPKTPLLVSKNKDKDFNTLCEQLGPPSRVMRWCCTIFKTGAIQRKISSLFKEKKQILTFYGIRRNESKSRSKYDRESDGAKIAKQKTVSPIIDWLDFDIWLYLLTTNIDFNKAYRLGYTRVGCWCCPNNSIWSEFMSKIYMPDQYNAWHSLLVDFATRIGKPDAEDYVNDGMWKARQGGNGLDFAKSSALSFKPCVIQENTLNFDLTKPITNDLYELFKPFGYVNKDLGNSRIGEVFITDRDGNIKLKLQGKIGSYSLKVSILDKNASHSNSYKAVEDKVKCQITKYQMCMGCLGCEGTCKFGAISIITDKNGILSYSINNDKCVRCGFCINHYDGGCYMRKVTRTKI